MTPLPRIMTFTIPHASAAASHAAAALSSYEQGSGHALDRVAKDRNHIVDMALLDDQGRRHRKAVAAHAEIKPAIEAIHHHVITARADAVAARRQLNRAHQADIADVDDVRQALERMQCIAPVLGKRSTTREQPLVLVDVE